MEYFNIDKYKDWEVDTEYSSDYTSKFFKKDDKKVKIRFYEDDIITWNFCIKNPYTFVKSYFLNKSLKCSGIYCYEFHIGVWKFYDETGKLINEIDYDKPYKFSLKEVIEKVKKEYDSDLEDTTQKCVLERFTTNELNDKYFYGVSVRDKENESKIQYILLDGTTGETLFITYFMLQDDSIPPFAQYMESLKKATEEGDQYFTTYKGKKYTKREWKVYEEEWYKNHQEKKNSKGFWDDLFKKP